MAKYITPSPDGKEPFIGCYTLTDFADWCREHGIPCTPEKLRAGLLAGVFKPAAWAVRSDFDPDKIFYFIFPARLERWAQENAIDYR